MNLVDLGLFFVFASNAVMLVMVAFIALRLQRHAQQARQHLEQAADALRTEGQLLSRAAVDAKGTFEGVRGEVTRLLEACRQQAGASRDAYQAWAARDPKGLHQLINDQGKLLDQARQAEPAQLPEWQETQRRDLERVNLQKKRLQLDLDQLKREYEDSQRQLRDWQQRARAQAGVGAENAQLKADLDRLRSDVEAARERARRNETRCQQLALELTAAQRADAARGASAPGEATLGLQRQLEEAERERVQLQRRLAQLQDHLKRTLTEKAFIEERFLALDAAQPPAAQEAPVRVPAPVPTPAAARAAAPVAPAPAPAAAQPALPADDVFKSAEPGGVDPAIAALEAAAARL